MPPCEHHIDSDTSIGVSALPVRAVCFVFVPLFFMGNACVKVLASDGTQSLASDALE